MFTVGPVQENCFIVRAKGSDRAVIVDPGEEADRLLEAVDELGIETVEAILLTHTHFDHIGAVAPVAAPPARRSTAPSSRRRCWPTSWTTCRGPGFGPFESYEADHTVDGGETLELAGLTIEVIFTPGHSPGHVTYAVRDERRAVLRRRAVPGLGRPGRPARAATGRRCSRSIETLLERVRRRDDRLPGPHGHHHARARARHQPVPARARAAVSRVIQAPRGTFDVLPEDAARREAARGARASGSSARAGYRRIETPAFEATELFARGVGEATDIVQKEMYTFDDGGGRSLTLRPEGTAPVCRAYIEHGMHKLPQPVKLWYLSSFFRAEAPQRGRYRQFWQVGAEAIGSGDARDRRRADRAAGRAARGGRGRGHAAAALEPRHARDARRVPRGADRPTCARTRTSCPPRCAAASTSTRCARSTPTDPGTREVMQDAPKLLDRLDRRGRRALRRGPRAARRRRARLRARPDARARARLLHAHGVRVHQRRARRAVRRRRRRALRPADRAARRAADARLGWAAGVERMLLAGRRAAGRAELGRPVRRAGRAATRRATAFELAREARRAGLSAQLELAGRSLKGQLKHADRIGARYVAIVGERRRRCAQGHGVRRAARAVAAAT